MSIKRTIENGIETFEAELDGERIVWDRGLTYADHLQTDPLLSAQVPMSGKHDEMLFIIMHQTMELWIKLQIHECKQAMAQIRADELPQASRTLDRIATIMQHMIHSWEVLATLSPSEFMTFRGYLGKASGFQSHQYRELEFRLGLKRPELITIHMDDPERTAALEEALAAPSLYDEMLYLLDRRGYEIPKEVIGRDLTKPYESDRTIENAWLEIYSNPQEHWELYALAEKVTSLEYYFQEWRFKHMKTVSRVIGHRHGTGGSAGVKYLVKALELRFFPELWSMRTRMEADKPEGGSHGGGHAEGCPV
ncbi:tryptophan 2,3-dioxygenase [Aurantiacibacter sediminis]|uniref:tryptophan 2,3-dioxygenase n=1 Tax=Aurantiacibacter sediminis TaxID=2793064 RepID=UPI0018F8C5A7|nr:tryptophan 2,3-dioxygenase family protein [Aurantiacibacter sediminis]